MLSRKQQNQHGSRFLSGQVGGSNNGHVQAPQACGCWGGVVTQGGTMLSSSCLLPRTRLGWAQGQVCSTQRQVKSMSGLPSSKQQTTTAHWGGFGMGSGLLPKQNKPPNKAWGWVRLGVRPGQVGKVKNSLNGPPTTIITKEELVGGRLGFGRWRWGRFAVGVPAPWEVQVGMLLQCLKCPLSMQHIRHIHKVTLQTQQHTGYNNATQQTTNGSQSINNNLMN